MSGSDAEASPSELDRLGAGLEELSYYEYLGLELSADYVEIREAFHRRSQEFHPDRFLGADESSKERAYAVYKRMTEAYGVLSDPELRRNYDGSLCRGESRLPAESRSRRLNAEERELSNPFARIFLRSAQQKYERGAFEGAWVDVELALSLEDVAPLRALQQKIASEMT